MEFYPFKTSELRFSNDYRDLVVVVDGQVKMTYDLDLTGRSVELTTSTTGYTIQYTRSFQDPVHRLDVGAGTVVTFDRARMSGIGVIDLRDTGRASDDYKVVYDLAESPFRFQYTPGPFALWLWFQGTPYSYEPQ